MNHANGIRRRTAALAAGLMLVPWIVATARLAAKPVPGNLVQNGDFEAGAGPSGEPLGWHTSGIADIRQTLRLVRLEGGGHAAALDCRRFVPGSPASHAMLAQTGTVGIEKGQWYHLHLRFRSRGIRHSLHFAVRDTRTWTDCGITASFPPSSSWTVVDRYFRARTAVPAEHSRLQIWFMETGRLEIDKISLTPTRHRLRRLPEIPRGPGLNPIPNSSFECGAGDWGSLAPDLRAWGNLSRRIGRIDAETAWHGRASLRITLGGSASPTYDFDYFFPTHQPVNAVITGNAGWLSVTPGAEYTLSVWLKSSRPGTGAVLFVQEASGGNHRLRVRLSRNWRRYRLGIRAASGQVWVGAGPALSAEAAATPTTVWLDAFQFEPGDHARAYRPRLPVESRLCLAGPAIADPASGIDAAVRAWNDTAAPAIIRGVLSATDFWDRPCLRRDVRLQVAAHSGAVRRFPGLFRGHPGYYRLAWKWSAPGAPAQRGRGLRCAVTAAFSGPDSVFGMNHAFPQAFLLRLARRCGLLWMRDWSVKWQTVEPAPGRFDFSAPDIQIGRVLDAGLAPLVLLPFPSAPWCSRGDPKRLRKFAGGSAYKLQRFIVACAPRDDGEFRKYVARVARHYRGRVRAYEIFNEALFTTYALPARFGYRLDDYLRLLRIAADAIHGVQPEATVIGGLDAWAGSKLTREFVRRGGLDSADALDLHLYPDAVDPEIYAEDLAGLKQAMKSAGKADAPIWLTEFGCYADDTPSTRPALPIGDATMSRSNWPNERAAAENLVKTAAVFFGFGVTKIFFHAGTGAVFNQRPGSGVFFAYGGRPRKMVPALATLARLLGPAPEPLGHAALRPARLAAWYFRGATGPLAIVWTREGGAIRRRLPAALRAFDISGAPLSGTVSIGPTPLYLAARTIDSLHDFVEALRP